MIGYRLVMGSSTLLITNHLNKSIDMTNEWHVLEYAVLFASHNVLSLHGGLSHFTVQCRCAHGKVLRIHYYHALSFRNNQVWLV
jgi:hypothetical protein